MGFSKLGLSSKLCETIASLGYHTPTPVQQQAIPYALRGQDILACAQTGTGKTAGFLLPLIEILSDSRAKARMPRAIILEPTRELALQVLENFNTYAKSYSLKAALLVGGESLTQQEKILQQGVDVLIATPGRLLDLLERGKIMLLETKYVVIDEADRMLDMGFIPDVNRLMAMLPRNRQTLLFSATLADEIKKLVDTYLVQPKKIIITPEERTAATIEQHYVAVGPRQKREAVRHLLSSFGKDTPNIIFCNRKSEISILVSSLKRHGFDVEGLHGDLTQTTRNKTLKDFKENPASTLVASDVAARGLDVDKLGLVINFDVPINAEDYVHRIGRTGRAGQTGKAFTLVTETEKDKKLWMAVEKFIQQQIPVFSIPFEKEKPFKAPGTKKPEIKKPELKAPVERKVSAEIKESVEPKSPVSPSQKMPHKYVRKERFPSYEHPENVVGFGEFAPAFILKKVSQKHFSLEKD